LFCFCLFIFIIVQGLKKKKVYRVRDVNERKCGNKTTKDMNMDKKN